MSVEPKVPASLDEEFAQIEQENIDAGIEEGEVTPPVETPEKKEETPAPKVETQAKDDDEDDDEPATPPKKEEVVPPVETPKNDDTHDLDTSQHRRPARYIPIPQYKEEKASWEAEKTKLEADLRAALEKGKDGATIVTPTTPEEKKTVTEKIQAYAESRGMEVAEVQELADTLKDAIFGGNFEKFNRILETQEKSEEEKRLDEEDARVFGEQFSTTVAPILKATYPNATEAQLAAMRSHMDMLGHTPRLAQTPLEYIFDRHRKEFDALVTGEEAPVVEEKPAGGGRSALGGRSGAGKGMGANDFVGKTDFSDLMKIPEDQQNAIIRDMDMKTYDAFTKYVADQDRDTLVVNRNGRKVVLK